MRYISVAIYILIKTVIQLIIDEDNKRFVFQFNHIKIL